MLNPLRSEAEAFRLLLYVIVVVVIVIAMILIIRSDRRGRDVGGGRGPTREPNSS